MSVSVWLATLSVACMMAAAQENADAAQTQYRFDIQIAQVLTNVTGDGVTSQTIAGVDGSVQVLHESLDGVKLVMEGGSLTWNGKEAPEHPRITVLSSPQVVTVANAVTTVQSHDEEESQYFVPAGDGLYALKTWDAADPMGMSIELTPGLVQAGTDRLDCGFRFRYSWVKDREPVAGVHLNVGKPIISTVAAEGNLGFTLGQWTCYRTTLASKGMLYVFIKASKFDPAKPAQ